MKRIMILVLAITTGLGVLAYTTHSAPQADDVKVISIEHTACANTARTGVCDLPLTCAAKTGNARFCAIA